MALSTSEINFVYSGGSNNSNPTRSLGGIASSFPILGGVNNLFVNITSAESEAGKIDYRCFYVLNESSTDTLYNASIFILSQVESGSTVQLGIAESSDVQNIEVAGNVTGGGLVLSYNGTPFSVSWGGSSSSFALNLSAALTSIGLPGIAVSSSPTSSSLNNFIVSFQGASGKRSHPLLSVVENNLISSDIPLIRIFKKQEGQPINSLAPLLAVETVAPSNVLFSNTNSQNKIVIGDIAPGDSFPVWIKRTTPAGTDFKEGDNFIFRLVGGPFAT